MATATGKKARRAYGNRFAAKRAKRRKKIHKTFGRLQHAVKGRRKDEE
jgi:hypothetical protein